MCAIQWDGMGEKGFVVESTMIDRRRRVRDGDGRDRDAVECLGGGVVVRREPAPIRRDEVRYEMRDVERQLFEEFRGQQELDSERGNRLDGLRLKEEE